MVRRPAVYELQGEKTLADVIELAGGVLPAAALEHAELQRLNAPDFRPSVESFDLTTALANPADSPKLQPLDTIRIFSRYDFEPAPMISIAGEVNAPGKYRTSGQARLRDAIYLAGGTSQDA